MVAASSEGIYQYNSGCKQKDATHTIDCFTTTAESILLLGEERVKCAPMCRLRDVGSQEPISIRL
jgi:hypothetical protein